MQDSNDEKDRARVFIFSTQPIIRTGLRTVLSEAGFEIVAESDTVESAVSLAVRVGANLIILDLDLSEATSSVLLEEMCNADQHAHLVIYTKDLTVPHIRLCLSRGVRGIMTRDTAPAALVHALHVVMLGELFLSGKVISSILEGAEFSDERLPPEQADRRYATLSPREREILSHIMTGKTSREIATHFFISHRTVDNHRSRIMRKLGLHGPVELVRYGVQLGLLAMDESRQPDV